MIRVAEQTESEASRRTRGIMDDAPRLGNVYGFTLEQLSIRPDWNSREVTFDHTRPKDLWLAESIRDSGVLEALTVVKEGETIFITNGHRRHAAATYARDVLGAKLERIPCRLEPRGSSPLDILFSQRDRNGGEEFTPLENGVICKKALALGATMDEVARRMHISKGYVESLLDLLSAPVAVTDLIRSETIAPTLAIQVIREERGDGAAAAERLAEAVETAKAHGKAKATRKHLKAKPKAAPGAEVVSVAKNHPTYQAAMRDAVEIVRGFLSTTDGDGETGEVFVVRQVVDALEAELVK